MEYECTDVAVDDLAVEEEAVGAKCVKDSPLPRGRSNRDLMTVMYDLNRRRAYIQAARLYASIQRWSSNLKELGA